MAYGRELGTPAGQGWAVLDLGKLAMALVDAGTNVVGTPTVLTGPHPERPLFSPSFASSKRPEKSGGNLRVFQKNHKKTKKISLS